MPDLVFTIKTPAELQGAEAAAEQLEVAIAKAKALGKEYGGLEERLGAVKASIGNYKAANVETSKEVEAHTGKVHGLGKAISLLGSQLGELGHLLHFVFSGSGIGLAIAAVAIGIGKLVERVKEWQEKILEKAERTAAVWEDQRKRIDEAKEASTKYKEAVDEIAKSTDKLKTKEDAELAVLNAVLTARMAILKAQEDAEIAAAGGDKVKEAEIHARFGARQTQEEAAAEQSRIDLMKRNLAQAQKDAAAAMAKSKALEGAGETPGADLVPVAGRIAEARQKESVKLIAEMNSEMNSNILRNRGLGGKSLPELQAYAKQQAQQAGISLDTWMASSEVGQQIARAAEATKKVAENQQEISDAEKLVADFKREDEKRKSQATAATEDWRTKDADVQARARAIAEAEAVQKVTRVESGAVAAANYAGTKPGGVELIQAAEIADAAKAGQKLDAGQQAILKSVFDLLGGNAQNNAQILEIIRRANDNVDSLKKALAIEASRAATHRNGPI